MARGAVALKNAPATRLSSVETQLGISLTSWLAAADSEKQYHARKDPCA